MLISSLQENSSLKRGRSQSLKSPYDCRRPEVSHQVQLNFSQENSSFNRGRLRSPKSANDHRRPEVSPHVQLNSSLENSSFKRDQSQSPESHRNRSISPAVDADAEHNFPFHGTTEGFTLLATSSSLDEQVMMKEQFCTGTIKLATPRTESSSTNDGDKKEKMMLFVCP